MKKQFFKKFLALFLTGTMLAGVGCKSYDDDIDSINKKLDELETVTIKDLQSQIDGVKSSVEVIEDLSSRLSTLEGTVEGMGDVAQKLRDLEIPEKRRSLVLTRDLFLFACYAGTAYADTISITRENLFTDDEGSLWLKYRRKKNELTARVKLLPEAIALIEKYRDDSRATLFPNQLYSTLRANMKILRVLAGLTTELVYHMGRHSFASLVTLEEGVPIETISKMLGHNNIKTTQIYARITNSKIGNDMQGLDKKFVGIEKIYKEIAL